MFCNWQILAFNCLIASSTVVMHQIMGTASSTVIVMVYTDDEGSTRAINSHWRRLRKTDADWLDLGFLKTWTVEEGLQLIIKVVRLWAFKPK